MYWSYIPITAGILLLIWSFRRNDFALSYASMLPGATLYFVAPGLLVADEYKLFPEATRAVACLYVTACLVLGVWGWTRPFNWVGRLFPTARSFPPVQSIASYCIGAILFSAYFEYKLRGVDVELLEQTQWSGPHVIYRFLTQPGYLSTGVAAVSFAVTRRPLFAILAVVAASIYLLPPVLGGKRDEIVEAAAIAAVCWTIVWNRPIPRTFVIAFGVFCALLFSAIGIYRTVAKSEGVAQGLQQALSSQRLKDIPPERRYVETNNYLAIVESMLQGRPPTLGLWYWNGLVHRYVPGQLIGTEVKELLQFENASVSREEIREMGVRSTIGATTTGFSDTIQAFWFLGPFIFYITGRYLSAIYHLACHGSPLCLFIYSHLLVKSGVAVTHSTMSLICASINACIFLAVAMAVVDIVYARGIVSGTHSRITHP